MLTPWTDHPAIRAITGTVRTRLGVSPNHISFRVGVIRTHLLTAALAHAAASQLAATAEVYLRWDDTDVHRAKRANEAALLAELQTTAAIPLDGLPSGADTLRQSRGQLRYRAAAAALTWRGLTFDMQGKLMLDLRAVDEMLASERIDVDALVGTAVVNVPAHHARYPERAVALTRADGTALWHLATVVDDIELGINLIVRGIDKLNAVSIQERLRAILAPGARVAYLFLPRLRETGNRTTRVADLATDLVRPSALRWYLAEPYLQDTNPVQTFDDIVVRIKSLLPTPRDSQLDLRRLAAFDRKISAVLQPEVAIAELATVVGTAHLPLVADICRTYRRPLPDQLRAYRAELTQVAQ